MVQGAKNQRRPRGTGSLTALGPGVWRVQVFSGRDPMTGKARRRGRVVHGSKSDAEKALRQLLADDQERRATKGSLADLLRLWLEHHGPRLAPSTLRTHRGYVEGRIIPALGHVPLAELRAFHLDALYARWLAEGCAPGTVRRCHAILSAALNQAVKWDLLATNPAAKASPPSGRPLSESRLPSVDTLRAWLDRARQDDPVLATAATLAALTGARRGELCALRWSDVNDDTILIARSVTRSAGRLVEAPTKTRLARRLVLDTVGQRVVREHQEWQRDLAAQVGVPLAPDPWLLSWWADASRPASPDTLTHRWHALTGGALRFHDLRHWAATQALRAGVPVRDVAARLGHASARMTLDRYAHALPAGDRDAAVALGKLLDASSNKQ